MWKYYLKLAWLSIRKTPVLSTLMVVALATGIAANLTTLTLYSVITSNPMAHKNDTLFAIQLDSWDPDEEFWGANGVPTQLTYRDAAALYNAEVGEEVLIMSRAGLTIGRPDTRQSPRVEASRLTTNSFFKLFDVRFIAGGPWSETVDRDGGQQVVISETLRDHFFPEQDAVGRPVLLDGETYTVTGVVADDWSLTPSVYDLQMGAFKEPPHIYIPFFNHQRHPFPSWGNTNGWKYEEIRSHQDFLMSENVWVHAWASLTSEPQRQDFEQFLRNYINDQKQAGRFQRPLKYHLNSPGQWLDIHDVVSRDDQILVALSFAFLLVCLINAAVLLLAKFLRKAPEAGLRRALGASRGAIFVQHLTEAAAIGIAGGLLGLLLSWAGLAGIRMLYDNYQAVAVMSGFTISAALVLALSSSLLSGLLPAWQIARAQPSIYLKSR